MTRSAAWWIGDIDQPGNTDARRSCPACGHSGLQLFYGVDRVTVHSCLMMDTEQAAREFPRGDLKLGVCPACGFVTNVLFNQQLQDYTSVYEDQQSYSPTFVRFADKLARDLIERYDLRRKRLVEIGCSKGDFLISMCEIGENRGIGIDPTAIPGRVESRAAERVTFIQDYYSEKYSDQVGDMILCRHTLEHIPDVERFVRIVRNSIGDRNDVVVFFEVPDVIRVLREQAFWDIYYEHCSYFSPGSLARLFRRCGFAIEHLALEYDDQYLIIEARPVSTVSTGVHSLEESAADMRDLVRGFSAGCRTRLSNWTEFLGQARAEGKRVAVWGSGSKCVSFFTTLGLTDEVGAIIDINPHRHHRYIVGAVRPVREPEYLKEFRPDIVIVMNPIYKAEITDMITGMGLHPEITAV